MVDDVQFGELKGAVSGLADSMSKIETALLLSAKTREERHAEVIKAIAVIQEQNQNSKLYETKCDTDRNKIFIRLDHVEGFQRRQLKIVAVMSAVIGFFIQSWDKIVEVFKHG